MEIGIKRGKPVSLCSSPLPTYLVKEGSKKRELKTSKREQQRNKAKKEDITPLHRSLKKRKR